MRRRGFGIEKSICAFQSFFIHFFLFCNVGMFFLQRAHSTLVLAGGTREHDQSVDLQKSEATGWAVPSRAVSGCHCSLFSPTPSAADTLNHQAETESRVLKNNNSYLTSYPCLQNRGVGDFKSNHLTAWGKWPIASGGKKTILTIDCGELLFISNSVN